MTDFPIISGADISAINNKEFIRIETDKAQDIVIALEKSGIPFSAQFGDGEMVLIFDGSYKEKVEGIIKKAMSGDYEALLRELQVYGVPDGYYRLLGEVADLLNTTVGALKNHPDEIQIALCKTYTDLWLCDDTTIKRELDRILSVNGRTLSDIRENEQNREQYKASEQSAAEKNPTLSELFDSYNRRNSHAHFTRESLRQLSEITRHRQQAEQEQIAQREEFERSRRI